MKQYHSTDETKLASLQKQTLQLQQVNDEYIEDTVNGKINPDRLTFDTNKVFKTAGNEVKDVTGHFGEVFYPFADVNCRLWHEQEKVYDFEVVPVEEKNAVVKQLALLNLERNKCIDSINNSFSALIIKSHS